MIFGAPHAVPQARKKREFRPPRAYTFPLWVISGHGRADQGCPLYPQEQTFSASASMSAKCQ